MTQTPATVQAVDDDARSVRLLRDLLTLAGYRVREAESDLEALLTTVKSSTSEA